MRGVERQSLRLTEGVHAEFGRGARYFHAFVFGISLRLDAQIDRHAERVQVLVYLPDNPESLLSEKYRVLELKFWRTAGFEPLHKEVSKLLVCDTLKDLPQIFTAFLLPSVCI